MTVNTRRFYPNSVLYDKYGTRLLTVSGTDGVRLGVDAEISITNALVSGTINQGEPAALSDAWPVLAISPNVLSVGNTTTSVPTIGSPFIGTTENVLDYAEITISLATEQLTTHSGTAYFEFSPNGVDWDVSIATLYYSSSGYVPTPLRVVLPYFRVKYYPLVDNLTAFRLSALYHRGTSKQLTRFLDQSLHDNEPIEVVRAAISGKSPTGEYLHVPTDSKGRLTTNDGSMFARILNHRVENDEEIRLDMEAVATDNYIGYAPDGSSESDPVWKIVRIYLSDTKQQNRIRFRQNIRWDQRTLGWT